VLPRLDQETPMLFALAIVITLAGMIWLIIWTLRHGQLPPTTFLRSVTPEDMPVAFWLFVTGLSFATAVATTISATIILAALPRHA
jgi:hypothetical protein